MRRLTWGLRVSLFKKRAIRPAARTEEQGERRQLSVLFYDIVGSTSLVDGHDPERLRSALNQIHETARDVLTDHGGTLEQVMGDGGMAYFGYPIISEDAAVQAVAAGLELLAARGDIPNAPNIRIGVATSIVVMSEAPSEVTGTLGAVGVAPNLAARLENAAEPNTMLVGKTTYDQTFRGFDYTPVAGLSLKGFPDETRAWQANGLRNIQSRFARDRDASAALCGRDAEVSALFAAWDRMRLGRGVALLIEGEAGIGKSRIAAELVAKATDARVVLLQCQPRTQTEALSAVIRMYDQAYSAGLDDLLSQTAVSTAEALATFEEDDSLSPEARRGAILQAVTSGLETLAEDKPLLILAEDLHWADEVTLAVLERLARSSLQTQMMLLATSRPSDALGDLRHTLTPLDLAPLNREASYATLRAAATAPLTQATADWIVSKGDGNPLFLTELAAHASDVAQSGGAIETQGGAELGSLRDLLGTRLELAGRAKRTAQLASVIGREYPHDLLARLAGDMPSHELDADLQRLHKFGITCALDNGHLHSFRHALIRDVAYDSQLRSVRQRLHGQIVDLIDDDPTLANDVPDIIMAEHCLAAERTARGIGLLIDVAEDAVRRSAMQAPKMMLERALALLPGLDDTPTRAALMLRALVLLGPLVTLLQGPRAAAPLYEAGQEPYFALTPEQRAPFFPVLWGWWFTASDLREQARRSEILIRDVAPDADTESRLQALHCGWATLFDGGAHDRCLSAVSEGLALYEPEAGRTSRHLYGHDAKVCGLGERALSGWLTGQLEMSAQAVRQCEAWGDETDHLGSQLHGLDIAMQVAVFRQDVDEIDRILAKMEGLSGAEAAPVLAAKRQIFRGWRAARQGQPGQIEAVSSGLAALREFGVMEDTPFYADIAADIAAQNGQARVALGPLEEEIAASRDSGLTYWLPELLRRKAVLLGGGTHAAASLEEAFAIAADQGAHMLTLRAAGTWHELLGALPPELARTATSKAGNVADCALKTMVLDALSR